MRRPPPDDDAASDPVPAPLLPDSLRRATATPLRIRIRATHRRCHVEWATLEALVHMAQRSNRAVEVECVTSGGTSVLVSLV